MQGNVFSGEGSSHFCEKSVTTRNRVRRRKSDVFASEVVLRRTARHIGQAVATKEADTLSTSSLLKVSALAKLGFFFFAIRCACECSASRRIVWVHCFFRRLQLSRLPFRISYALSVDFLMRRSPTCEATFRRKWSNCCRVIYRCCFFQYQAEISRLYFTVHTYLL